MSFVRGLEKLEAGFNTSPRVEAATLGDGFRPTEDFPNTDLEVGTKIERKVELQIPHHGGELLVAASSRLILLDPVILERSKIPLVKFATMQGDREPLIFARHSIDWTEEGTGPHATRLYSGFSREALAYDDQEWEAYQKAMEAWDDKVGNRPRHSDNKPRKPLSLPYKMLTSFKPTREGYDGTVSEELHNHDGVLNAVAEQLPAFAHYKKNGVYGWGFNSHRTQNPSQLEAHVDWLLEA